MWLTAILVSAVLVLSNFIYQAIQNGNFVVATERSWFQVIAIFIFVFVYKLIQNN